MSDEAICGFILGLYASWTLGYLIVAVVGFYNDAPSWAVLGLGVAVMNARGGLRLYRREWADENDLRSYPAIQHGGDA